MESLQFFLDEIDTQVRLTRPMPIEIVLWLLEEVRRDKAAEDGSGGSFRQFLRNYGVTGGSDWDEAKADVDKAMNSPTAAIGVVEIRHHLEEFARGELGRWRPAFEKWFAERKAEAGPGVVPPDP